MMRAAIELPAREMPDVGKHVHLGHGAYARREVEPACQIRDLPDLDLAVLSHYQGVRAQSGTQRACLRVSTARDSHGSTIAKGILRSRSEVLLDVGLLNRHAVVMLRLRGVTIDCPDSDDLASFWTTALGYETRALWRPYAGAKDPHSRDPHLTFQQSAEAGTNHLHLDLYADDPDAEATRLVESGAERIRRVEEGDTWWWVLRDPSGNTFCVIAALGQDRTV